MSNELKILEITCSNCGAINPIRYAFMRDERVKCEKCAYKKKAEIDVTLRMSQAQDHEAADYTPRQALSQAPLVHVEAQAHSHICKDCADVIRTPGVMERLFAEYLVSKMALPPEFFAWFRERPHSDPIEFSEVFDAYEQFKREGRTK